MNNKYLEIFIDNFILKETLRLRMNEISSSWNENRHTAFISAPYFHYTKGCYEIIINHGIKDVH